MIIKEALDFVGSAEMREHLETTELKNINTYLTLICEAPVPLTKKAEALKIIAHKYNSPNKENRAQKLADAITQLMKELSRPKEGSVFTLTYVERECHINVNTSWKSGFDQPVIIPVAHYTSFKAISEEIRRRRNGYNGQLNKHIYNNGFGEYKWAHVAQFSPVTQEDIEDGLKCHPPRRYNKDTLYKRMDLTLDGKANVIYADTALEYLDDPCMSSDVYNDWAIREGTVGPFPILSGLKSKIYLSTPFKAGDIVTIDERPFRALTYAVMLDDTRCIFIDTDNSYHDVDINYCRFRYDNPYDDKKGPHYFFHNPYYYPTFNPVLRAERFTGALPKREATLETVAEVIRGNPDLTAPILKNAKSNPNKMAWPGGLSWRKLANELGLS